MEEEYAAYRSSGGAYLFIPDSYFNHTDDEAAEAFVSEGGVSLVSRGELLDEVLTYFSSR